MQKICLSTKKIKWCIFRSKIIPWCFPKVCLWGGLQSSVFVFFFSLLEIQDCRKEDKSLDRFLVDREGRAVIMQGAAPACTHVKTVMMQVQKMFDPESRSRHCKCNIIRNPQISYIPSSHRMLVLVKSAVVNTSPQMVIKNITIQIWRWHPLN